MDAETIVRQLEEVMNNVKKLKESSDGKARNWAVVNTHLETVLAYVKVYLVEESEE